MPLLKEEKNYPFHLRRNAGEKKEREKLLLVARPKDACWANASTARAEKVKLVLGVRFVCAVQSS